MTPRRGSPSADTAARPWRAALADRILEVRRALALVRTTVSLVAGLAVARLRRSEEARASLPRRIRLALEELGLTYLKLGQYLAMRFDVLPADVCRELGKLFDEVPPLRLEQVSSIIEESLEMPLEHAFESFNPEPLAAASVAQVHEAWTRDGERVAVKVQRPGIERVFAADIRIIRKLARLADRLHLLGRLSAAEVLDDFAAWTWRELDFVQEGRMAERVGQDPEPFEVEPKVHWELTTSRVLTLEFIEGVSLAQIVRIVEGEGPERLTELYPGIDIDLVLHHMTFSSLRQIFVKGLFHGDPHPGNILVLDDNRIAFIDFGIFGELSDYDRELLSRQIEQLALGNIDESLRAYAKQLTLTDESDQAAFRREARAVLQRWYDLSIRSGSPPEERHVARYIGQMIDISRRYRLLYEMRYLLYWRALNALDSTALRLSQSFDLMEELRAFFEEVQPGAGERIVAAIRDSRKWTAVAAFADEAPERVAALVVGRDGARRDWLSRATETTEVCVARHAEVRRLAVAVVAAGLLFVAARAHVPDAARLVAALVGLPMAFGSLVMLRRT